MRVHLLAAPGILVIWVVSYPRTIRSQRCLTLVIKWAPVNVARRRSLHQLPLTSAYCIYRMIHGVYVFGLRMVVLRPCSCLSLCLFTGWRAVNFFGACNFPHRARLPASSFCPCFIASSSKATIIAFEAEIMFPLRASESWNKKGKHMCPAAACTTLSVAV
jgi:hypothetical protein